MLSDTEKRTIAWNAYTIFEKTAAIENSNTNPPLQQQATNQPDPDLVSQWNEYIPFINEHTISERLHHRDLSVNSLNALSNHDALPDDTPLPWWITNTDTLLNHLSSTEPISSNNNPEATSENSEKNNDGEMPFIHIFDPILSHTKKQLTDTHDITRIPDTAIDAFEMWLLDELFQVMGEALYVDFRSYLAIEDMAAFTDPDLTTDTYYQEYVERFHTEPGVKDFFTTYPVLARFIPTIITYWIDAIVELDNRLDADWQPLYETFTDQEQPDRDQVHDAAPLDSDRHQHGRIVMELSLTEQTRVVYKPRSIKPSELFDDFLATIDAKTGISLEQKMHLPREEYGWVEYIAPKPCESENDLKQYYRSAGALLAAAHLLKLNDCHYENVVAHRFGPVVLDAETLLTPTLSPSFAPETDPATQAELVESVVATGFLPESHNEAALPDEVIQNGFAVPKLPADYGEAQNDWQNINTDGMTIAATAANVIELSNPPNLPTLDGNIAPFNDYVEQVVGGFKTVMNLAQNGGISIDDRFADIETRVVPRASRDYGKVIDAITSPDALKNGANITFKTDKLLAEQMGADTDSDEWELFNAEVATLKRLDIPRLTVNTSTGIVTLNDTDIPNLMTKTGLQRADDTFATLSEDAIQNEADAINISANPIKYTGDADGTEPPLSPLKEADGFGAVAGKLYDRTIDHAYTTPFLSSSSVASTTAEQTAASDSSSRETYYWTVRQAKFNNAPKQIPINNGLYEGRLGIALLTAALLEADIPTDTDRTESLHRLVTPTREQLIKNPGKLASNPGLGDGIAAIIYALATLSDMENSPSYRDELKTATAQVTETYIEDQWQNDLLNGRAGLLLALLKAAAVLDRDRETHLAKHCGETLLDQRIESPTGHSIWPVDGEPTHCTPGFAHGTTGIAYAFTRLVDATGDTKYLTAAKEVLAFESDRFNREENRWVEHTTRDHISNDSWCYGRAGIVLARLRIKQIASSIIPEPSIQTVVTDIDLDVTAATDQLCCGNAGAINTLLEAARTYDAPRYKQAATSAFTELLAKHDDRGLLQLNCHTPHRTNDALFQGISGVGYTAARLHAPDRVPDILSFQ